MEFVDGSMRGEGEGEEVVDRAKEREEWEAREEGSCLRGEGEEERTRLA